MSGASASPEPTDGRGVAHWLSSRTSIRLLLLLGAAAALITGTTAGLQRIGFGLLEPYAHLAFLHGPLMICGFFGTVIGLERAVALRTAWAFLAPAATAIGVAMLLATPARGVPEASWIVGSLVLTCASIRIAIRQPAIFTWTISVAALCWGVGTALWAAGASVPEVVLWWTAFLVLTISAERLELSRMLQPSATSRMVFLACVGLIIGAAGLGSLSADAAWPLAGSAFLGLAAWLYRHDIARRTIRLPGLPRFTAICLLSGYFWLGIAGLLGVVLTVPANPLAYDAVLHAVYLGFVFSMVFGHAPIILPAVARLHVPFSRGFYAPLLLLHLSVLIRLGADLWDWFEARRVSGVMSIAAVLLFVALMATLGACGKSRLFARAQRGTGDHVRPCPHDRGS